MQTFYTSYINLFCIKYDAVKYLKKRKSISRDTTKTKTKKLLVEFPFSYGSPTPLLWHSPSSLPTAATID